VKQKIPKENKQDGKRNKQHENHLKEIDMHTAAKLDHDNDPRAFDIDARFGCHLC
jgi:hypothetical protein